ncbi:MAG: hypothetical protein KAJ40_06880, partial [Alphaproteobacteria bacterium]|nr:hypothetical protein [Alphaproteobacteria bacterium]
MKQRKGGIMGHDDLEQQLDALLAQRTVPEMRSNLAFRIIETSRTVQQERSGFAGLSEKIKSVRCSFLKVIEAVLDCIALPRPAFAI